MLALNWATLIVVVLGVPGNILMLIVFSKKQLNKLSTAVYFRAIAVANLIILVNCIKLFCEDKYGVYLLNQTSLLCKLTIFGTFFIDSFSAWCLTATAFDGFVTIVHPAMFKICLTPFFALFLIIIIIIYNFLFYSNTILFYDLNETNSTSTNDSKISSSSFECESLVSDIINLMDLINSTIIPFMIMFVLTIVTVNQVLHSHNRMRRFSSTRQLNQTHQKDVRFSMTVIILNLVFLILNVPTPLMNTLGHYQWVRLDPFVFKLLIRFFTYLRNLFYAIVFYLQLAINVIIRKEFLDLFNRRQHSNQSKRSDSDRINNRGKFF